MRQRSGRTWQPSGGSLSTERLVPDPVALWTSTAFIEEARVWVEAQLARRGSRLTVGRVWFKVNGSGTAYEAELVALLGELRPGLAPDVIAYDRARAWSLTRDGGPMLRSTVASEVWR